MPASHQCLISSVQIRGWDLEMSHSLGVCLGIGAEEATGASGLTENKGVPREVRHSWAQSQEALGAGFSCLASVS